MTRIYRTLVRGKLVQESSLSVGGSQLEAGGADLQCARDGRNRLTIPGTGLAGCLVETAGRIFPDLLEPTRARGGFWEKISGKAHMRKPPTPADDKELRQSLWHFHPAHLKGEQTTEMRQGVGIRQATGATAAEARALFDIETIPAGRSWDLFFEIDTLRGEDKVEAAALLALWEWTQGRCWLGASAARGLGWMRLEDVEVLRLPLTKESLDAWPDTSRDRFESFRLLKGVAGVEPISGAAALLDKGQKLWGGPLPKGRFCYVTLSATVSAQKSDWGWDTLSVGGHAAGELEPLGGEHLLGPLGMRDKEFHDGYSPDAPIVTTSGKEGQRPFLPGSGVRGPLRHAASRWLRQGKEDDEVIDPNKPRKPLKKTDPIDEVAKLFGLAERGGRLLVRDARLEVDRYRLAWLQHHAEDEFTAGVYGSGKFDRVALLEGTFAIQLVIEGLAKDMPASLKALLPALRLAELGFMPQGGGKWRGHGWSPWRFTRLSYGGAGEEAKSDEIKDSGIVAALAGIKWEDNR